MLWSDKMRKELTFTMSQQIIDMASKPLRKREDAILLLLYTIRMFDLDKSELNIHNESIRISINKMNRIFYLLKGKMFSMQFPFRIENNDIQNGIRIYDSVTGILINATTLSFLIGLFEQINRPETDFETVFEIMMETEQNDDEFTMEQMWTLFSYLLKYDLGYIRYDIDPEHENGKLHPLYHLDICLDNSATYKIGLNQEIRFDNFKDILDTTTESWYIYRGQN